jgi:hypothetical protein
MLKTLSFGSTTSVSLFENKRIGMIVCRHPDFTSIEIYDLRNGFSQIVLVGPSVKDSNEIASAMVTGYQVLLLVNPEAGSLEKLIDGAGLNTRSKLSGHSERRKTPASP